MSVEEALRALLRFAANEAIAAVQPARCLHRSVALERDVLSIGEQIIDLAAVDRILVVGMGKASATTAAALESILGSRIDGGLVITADGYRVPTDRIEVREARHPIPDARGLAAAQRLASIVQDAREDDLVLVLISGGGSSLLCLPQPPVTLDDLVETHAQLLRSGLPIYSVNVVRKHLSLLKGGGLAELAHPARVVSLILSDVPGDRLDVIASGPTVPDPSTFADAVRLLCEASLWERLPSTVRHVLESGARGDRTETLKPDAPAMERVANVLIGSGRAAGEVAQRVGGEHGFHARLLSCTLRGEARIVGGALASIARRLRSSAPPFPLPAWLVATGETTVTVTGHGRGGRNQEVALSAAQGIAGLDGVVIGAVGTDGCDGPTDAAGGLVDGGTSARLRHAGIDIGRALADNASHDALAASGDLLITGPTGTNVADLVLLIVSAG